MQRRQQATAGKWRVKPAVKPAAAEQPSRSKEQEKASSRLGPPGQLWVRATHRLLQSHAIPPGNVGKRQCYYSVVGLVCPRGEEQISGPSAV